MKTPLIILFIFLSSLCLGQVSVKDSSLHFPLIRVSYAFQLPAGDLANRYGNNSNLGLSIEYKLKNNFYFGAEGSFIFGNTISEPTLFKNLITPYPEYNITDEEGIAADVRVFERGYTSFLKGGKIFPLFSPNPNSGFFIEGKFGFMQTKIRIETNAGGNPVPQLTGDYKNGYDRLTNGMAAGASFGYNYLSNRRLLNFFIAAEFIKGWTNGKRYNLDEQQLDKQNRNDILYGIRAGWIIPIYKKTPKEYYFN